MHSIEHQGNLSTNKRLFRNEWYVIRTTLCDENLWHQTRNEDALRCFRIRYVDDTSGEHGKELVVQLVPS